MSFLATRQKLLHRSAHRYPRMGAECRIPALPNAIACGPKRVRMVAITIWLISCCDRDADAARCDGPRAASCGF